MGILDMTCCIADLVCILRAGDMRRRLLDAGCIESDGAMLLPLFRKDDPAAGPYCAGSGFEIVPDGTLAVCRRDLAFLVTRVAMSDSMAKGIEVFETLSRFLQKTMCRVDGLPSVAVAREIIRSAVEPVHMLLPSPDSFHEGGYMGESGVREFDAYAQDNGHSFIHFQVAAGPGWQDKPLEALVFQDRRGMRLLDVQQIMSNIVRGRKLYESDPDPTPVRQMSKALGLVVARPCVGFILNAPVVNMETYRRYFDAYLSSLGLIADVSIGHAGVQSPLRQDVIPPGDEQDLLALARRLSTCAESARRDISRHHDSLNREHAFQSGFLTAIGFEDILADGIADASRLVERIEGSEKDRRERREHYLGYLMNAVAALAVASFAKDASDLAGEAFGTGASLLKQVFFWVFAVFTAVLFFLLVWLAVRDSISALREARRKRGRRKGREGGS